MVENKLDEIKTEVIGCLSPVTTVQVVPVGRWFEAFSLRRLHKQTLSSHSIDSSSTDVSSGELSDNEDDQEFLRSLDPKLWKDQDHYAVLGLEKLRYLATASQIKKAHKKKVLKHHPDKRKSRGEEIKKDDDYFTCITRAHEILGNPIKRRSYDSVDPQFDNDVPPINNNSKENFYEVFGPVFVRNARWSIKRHKNHYVPKLGNENSTFEEVNNFYSFWYEFDSWREYSYLDEEEKEKGENREERRWIEKQNKAARAKLKKEETTRLRTLVDNAYACDPRIQKFKDDEKEKKQAVKRARQEAAQQRKEEEERKRKELEEEERLKKEKLEEEAKAQAAVEKKEKDAAKKAMKKERKKLRDVCKEYSYFTEDETEKVNNMAEVEKLAELLSFVTLKELNKELTSGDKGRACKGFEKYLADLNMQLEKEKKEQLEKINKSSGASGGGGKSNKDWSEGEIAMLIKAVNLFPAGTAQRWEVVANFINKQCDSNFGAKDTLNKAKDLQKMDPTLKQEANEKAFDKFLQAKREPQKEVTDDLSQRFISVGEQQVAETGSNPAPWTSEEQKLLEQALKTYPASTENRWDRIAEVIPARSKKDCMKRYKELAELIKAKKAAAAKAAAKK